MKSLALRVALLVVFSAPFGRAGQVEKMYYLGEAKLTSPGGGPRGSQAFLLEKTHDPDHKLIIERALVVKADKSVEQYTMTMTVNGNDFSLKDDANTITGTGTLFGPAWHWTYFRAVYQAANGIKIEDENFLADPAVCVARKKITGPDGKPLMFMDITLNRVTPATFEILAGALLKK